MGYVTYHPGTGRAWPLRRAAQAWQARLVYCCCELGWAQGNLLNCRNGVSFRAGAQNSRNIKLFALCPLVAETLISFTWREVANRAKDRAAWWGKPQAAHSGKVNTCLFLECLQEVKVWVGPGKGEGRQKSFLQKRWQICVSSLLMTLLSSLCNTLRTFL